MRRLIESVHATLDGVMEAPANLGALAPMPLEFIVPAKGAAR